MSVDVKPVKVLPFKLTYKVSPSFWSRVRMLFGAKIDVSFEVQHDGNVECYADVEGDDPVEVKQRVKLPVGREVCNSTAN